MPPAPPRRAPTTCSSRPRRPSAFTSPRAVRSTVRGWRRSGLRPARSCGPTARSRTSRPTRTRRMGSSTPSCVVDSCRMPRPITFLSDYGLADEFVGVVHAVIVRICPEARIIDLGHGVPRHDVITGARMLARALPYAPAGVHLAVVDPEVGARRRAIALRTVEEDRLLVGPDNGLLLPAAERFGGVADAVEISASPWRLEPVSATLHGRDLFPPLAPPLAPREPPG